MRMNYLNILRSLFVLFFLSSIQAGSVLCQLLDIKVYQSRLLQAIENKDNDRIAQLLKSQRVDATYVIESLLDSAVILTARNEVNLNEGLWETTKSLSIYYNHQFDDIYYLDKYERYSNFSSLSLIKKVDIISLKKQGRQELLQGNSQSALETYKKAFELAQEINDVDDQAAIYGGMGTSSYYLGDYDTALKQYERSLQILLQIGDKLRIGSRYGHIANIYESWGDYSSAIEYYDKSLDIRQELDDKRGLASIYNNTGLICEENGDYYQALEHYKKALDLNRMINNERSIGRNLANIANVHINLGNYLEATKTYTNSLKIRSNLDDRRGEGNDLGNLGIVYLNLGEYAKASSHFHQALSIHREIKFREGEAYQLGRIASLLNLKGDYVEAIKTYQKAFQIHKEMNHVRGEAYWLEAIGQSYSALGDYDRAFENFQSALTLHQKIEDSSGQAVVQNSMGRTYLEMDKVQEAKACFEKALQIHKDLGEEWDECSVLGNLGYMFSLMNDSVSAITHWNEAIKLAEKMNDKRFQGWLQQQLGDFYREHNETVKAAKAYEQGLAITDGLEDPELRWELYLGQGHLWRDGADYERAYFSYKAAINAIESIRSKGVVEEYKASIMHNRYEAYDAMISVLVKMDNYNEAFEYSERARARSLLDQIGNTAVGSRDSSNQFLIEKEKVLRAKIETLRTLISYENEDDQLTVSRGTTATNYRKDLFEAQKEYQNLLIDLKIQNPEYSSLVTVEPSSVVDIQKTLDDQTVIFEYFVSEDQTIIFGVSENELRVLSVPEGRNSLQGKIWLFQGSAVQNMDGQKLSENFWIKPLQGLYEILIDPIRKTGFLDGKKHLIVIPQGILFFIPFQALITKMNNDGQNPHFLVEDYIISYAPSATILKYCQNKKYEKRNNILLLAPKTNDLPFSQQEVNRIAKYFGKEAVSLLEEAATESRLKRQVKDYDLIHVATTAHFNKSNPVFSRLDLIPSELDDGKLEVHEIFGLNLKADLVTLSACQTAMGSGYQNKIPQGDDFVSFTYAFLYAGTPSVVASLWEVNDRSTALFMEKFYKYLKSNNKAEALAQTQRNMISGEISDENHNSHPYFWAPFVLVGDWK